MQVKFPIDSRGRKRGKGTISLRLDETFMGCFRRGNSLRKLHVVAERQGRGLAVVYLNLRACFLIGEESWTKP